MSMMTRLSQVAFCSDLTTEQLELMARGSRVVSLEKHELLFTQGSAATGFFLLESGLMELAARNVRGDKRIMEIITPGMEFGQAAMFICGHYPVSAEAIQPSTVISIPKSSVDALIDSDPRASRLMIAALSKRLRQRVYDVESLTLYTATGRLVGYLLSHTDPQSVSARVELPISKTVLASLLGMNAATLSRCFKELSSVIEVEGKTITIANCHALRQFLV